MTTPSELTLREVYVIAKHDAGGIILGFEPFHRIGRGLALV